MSETTIHANGSRWAGEAPATLDELVALLDAEPLDPVFDYERYGRFVYPNERGAGMTFFGNFLHVSHVFRIDSDDPATIARLTDAIRRNTSRENYREARKEERSRRARFLLAQRRKDQERRRVAAIRDAITLATGVHDDAA